jgi:RNA polymerase sigma-70 factor, ECF subfamily
MQNKTEQIVDQILVMDAQSGRREALDTLISRWQKRLWCRAYNITGRTEVAWDIAQETWLDIVRGLHRLNDPAKFGGWAYSIASNKSRDWLGRNSLRRRWENQCRSNPPASAQDAYGVETTRDVRDVIRRLSPKSQEVLNLYYLEGLDLEEIARIIDAPPGTVKSRLHAARLEFREYWESLAETLPPAIPPVQEG